MPLTDEQKETVRKWAAEGATVGEMQNRLRDELGVALSYMETRLLVGELNVPLAEKPVAANPSAPLSSSPEPVDPAPGQTSAPGGKVTVTLDEIMAPAHAVLSGKVVFGDGVRASWYFDDAGRLALNPSTPGYRPAEAEVLEFQRELRRLVEERGI